MHILGGNLVNDTLTKRAKSAHAHHWCGYNRKFFDYELSDHKRQNYIRRQLCKHLLNGIHEKAACCQIEFVTTLSCKKCLHLFLVDRISRFRIIVSDLLTFSFVPMTTAV